MSYSSPVPFPQTPVGTRNPLLYIPLNSSPLAESSSPWSSPIVAAQARRKSQYKSQFSSSSASVVSSRSVSGSRSNSKRLSSDGRSVALFSGGEGDSQKTFFRDRLRARCLEESVKNRHKAFRGKRQASLFGSDDSLMNGEEDDVDDEDIIKDQLFRRVIENSYRKDDHAFRVSYAQQVGSSFDPDMEDVGSWEQELSGSNSATYSHGMSKSPVSTSAPSSSPLRPSSINGKTLDDLTPVEIDEEEIEAYAEEYYASLRAASHGDEGHYEDLDLLIREIEEEEAQLSNQRFSSDRGCLAEDYMDMS